MVAKARIARHRPHESQAIHATSHFGQVLADSDSGYRGADCAKISSIFGRSMGFRIERVEVARPAEQENEQHAFGAWRSRRFRRNIGVSRSRPFAGKRRQTRTQCGRITDLDNLPPRVPRAIGPVAVCGADGSRVVGHGISN